MVNVALIGAGNWGKNLVRNFNMLPDAEVKFICDLNLPVRQKMATLYPNATVTEDYEVALRDPEVDAMVVAVEDGVRNLPRAAEWQRDLKFRHNQLPRSTVQPVFEATRDDILTALKLSENEPNEFFRDNVHRDMRILIEDLDWQNFPKRQ